MKKKISPFVFLVIFILAFLTAFIVLEVFQSVKERKIPEEIEEAQDLPEIKEVIEECSPIDFSGYEIARVDDRFLELKTDLNGDQKEEIVRVYNQITETGFRSLPIMLKVFSGLPECPEEELSYLGEDKSKDLKENEIFDFQIFEDFWGDGRKVIILIGQQTAYGSGFTLYIHFFAFINGQYQKIDGPELSSLSTYKFKDEKVKGKEIVVAHGIWEIGEAHYDYHRYQFEIYVFDGQKYIKKEAGQTKEKYLGDIDEILQKEPEVLYTP